LGVFFFWGGEGGGLGWGIFFFSGGGFLGWVFFFWGFFWWFFFGGVFGGECGGWRFFFWGMGVLSFGRRGGGGGFLGIGWGGRGGGFFLFFGVGGGGVFFFWEGGRSRFWGGGLGGGFFFGLERISRKKNRSSSPEEKRKGGGGSHRCPSGGDQASAELWSETLRSPAAEDMNTARGAKKGISGLPCPEKEKEEIGGNRVDTEKKPRPPQERRRGRRIFIRHVTEKKRDLLSTHGGGKDGSAAEFCTRRNAPCHPDEKPTKAARPPRQSETN